MYSPTGIWAGCDLSLGDTSSMSESSSSDSAGVRVWGRRVNLGLEANDSGEYCVVGDVLKGRLRIFYVD